MEDQDIRWSIVQQLNRYDFSGAQTLLQTEIQRDASERGRQATLVAQAIRPDKEEKQIWIDELLKEDTQVKLSDFRAVWGRLFPGKQRALQEQFNGQLIPALSTLSRTKTAIFLDKLAENIIPMACSEANIETLNKVLANTAGINASLVKALKINRQYSQRCVAKREMLLTN